MKHRRSEILSVCFFLILSLFLFRPYILQHKVAINGNLLVSFFQPFASYTWKDYSAGPTTKPIGADTLRIYYPTRELVTSYFVKGKAPLWNPYQFSGNVLLGTFQSAVTFPLGILFLIIPHVDAWSIIELLEPFFGCLGMYLFLREILSSKKAIFFGAIVFGCSGMVVTWWEEMFMAGYSVILLPFILYGIERVIKKQSFWSCLLLSASLFVSLSTGWFQMIFYSWIVAFFWVLYRMKRTKNHQAFLWIFIAVVAAICLSGVALLPSMEAYTQSTRGIVDAKGDFDLYLFPLTHLITFLAPDYYGNPGYYNFFGRGYYQEGVLSIGIVGFFFALYMLFRSIRKKGYIRFFAIGFLVSLSLGLSLPTSWFLLYTLKLPLVATLQPSRIFFVTAFCASVLAAYGLQEYVEKRLSKKLLLIVTSVILLGFAAGAVAAQFGNHATEKEILHTTISLRNLILPFGLFVLTVIGVIMVFIKSVEKAGYFFLMGITFFGVIFFAQKYLFFSDPDFIFPKTPVLTKLQETAGIDRFLGVGDGYIEKNFAIMYGLFSPEGYDSFNNRRYSELVYSSHTYGKYSLKMQRAAIEIMKTETIKDLLANPYRERMLSILGIRYLVEKHSDNDFTRLGKANSLYPKIWTDGIFTIYENKKSLPRVFLAYDYRLLTEPQEILNFLYDKNNNLRNILALEERPALQIAKNGKGSVSIASYTPDRVELHASTTENALLFLSDNMSPGWIAMLDGKQVKILRSDYSFRTVEIPKGRHTVIFYYDPVSFKIGIVVSFMGVGIFLGSCYYLLRKKHIAS